MSRMSELALERDEAIAQYEAIHERMPVWRTPEQAAELRKAEEAAWWAAYLVRKAQ